MCVVSKKHGPVHVFVSAGAQVELQGAGGEQELCWGPEEPWEGMGFCTLWCVWKKKTSFALV